jgi:hypothetical protein
MGDADRPNCAVGLTPMEKVIVLLTPNQRLGQRHVMESHASSLR